MSLRSILAAEGLVAGAAVPLPPPQGFLLAVSRFLAAQGKNYQPHAKAIRDHGQKIVQHYWDDLSERSAQNGWADGIPLSEYAGGVSDAANAFIDQAARGRIPGLSVLPHAPQTRWQDASHFLMRTAAKAPSLWDVEGTKVALNQIPGVEVKYVSKDPFGSVPHFRVVVPNFKTAIQVYPSPGYQKLIEVGPTKTIKGVPPTMSIKDSVATPQAVKALVEKWIAAYVKMNGAAAPAAKEPSVQRVLDHAYYGRPLPK